MAPPLILTRATEADLPAIAAVQYRAFTSPLIREAFMGCRSEADLPRLAAMYARRARADPADVWVRVADGATGQVVAASNWKVCLGAGAVNDDEPPGWLEGQALERSRAMLEGINAARRRANPGGYVHLHICFTDPGHRRRGAGALMMKWGCDLADLLFLPGWIEASPDGNFLYRTFGFYDFEKAAGGMDGTNMRRDPRRAGIEGGKVARGEEEVVVREEEVVVVEEDAAPPVAI